MSFLWRGVEELSRGTKVVVRLHLGSTFGDDAMLRWMCVYVGLFGSPAFAQEDASLDGPQLLEQVDYFLSTIHIEVSRWLVGQKKGA